MALIQQLGSVELSDRSALESFASRFANLLMGASGSGSNKPVIPNKFWVNRDHTLKYLSKSMKYVARKKAKETN